MDDIEAVKKSCSASQALLIDFVDEAGCRIIVAVRFKFSDIDDNLITLWTRKSKNSNFTPRRITKPVCLNGLTPSDIVGNRSVFVDWDTYPRFLEEKIKKLDQPKWNWHNLRHRRASMWASEGLTMFEIMIRLGHSNLQTMQKCLQLLGFTRL